MERDKEKKDVTDKDEINSKEQSITHIPPVSMDELSEFKNDLEQTEVKPNVNKRTPLNEDPDDGPNSPLRPPAL